MQCVVSCCYDSGVARSKLRVIPEPVDVHFFNPDRVEAATLPVGKPVSPRKETAECNLLSIFKWEDRKGWDILLTAYLKVGAVTECKGGIAQHASQEFSASDSVRLFLLTNQFHDDTNLPKAVHKFIQKHSCVLHLDDILTMTGNRPQRQHLSTYLTTMYQWKTFPASTRRWTHLFYRLMERYACHSKQNWNFSRAGGDPMSKHCPWVFLSSRPIGVGQLRT